MKQKNKTITKAEYYQIVGLLALSKTHMTKLRDIEESIKDITGKTEDVSCHVADAVYCEENAEFLLERLSIKVGKK